MINLVSADSQLLLYLGQLLHILAVVLQDQLGCLEVEADAEMPSTFGYELNWLTCKTLFTQSRVIDLLLPFAIDMYFNVFVAYLFLQADFDIDVGSFAVFEAEFRLPVETRATCQTTHAKENDHLYTYHRLYLSLTGLCLL